MAQVSNRRFYSTVLHALALPQQWLTMAQESQQNSLPMNLSPQLSTPARGPCTLLKGRGLLAVALEAWGLGAVNLLAYTVVGARPTGPE